MGRPAVAKKREEQYNVRVDDDQAAALAAIGFLDGTSPAELFRQLLDKEIRRRTERDPDFVEAFTLKRRVTAQRRAGVKRLPVTAEGTA